MATMSNSPITQVSQVPTHTNLQPQLLTRLLLDLRGRRFEVDRDTLMNLPESVLLCLFPNGLVLSRMEGDEEEYQYVVDVRPKISLRSEEHTSELQSHSDLVCRLLLEKKKNRQCLHAESY